MQRRKLFTDAMQIYEMFEGQPFRGGADDVIDYALNVQSDFMFNIGGIPGVGTDAGGTIAQAAHILSQEDPDKAQAFLDFMGAYEQLPTFTSAGVSRAFRSIFTDPTTYAGIVSAGAGLFARQTTQTGIKLGIKQALQQMARPAQFATQRPVAAGALAGAGYSEVGEVGQMAVETAAGDAPTPLEAGIRATVAPAVGAAVGAGLAKGAQTVLPPVGQAIGDLFEGMGEGAKKRMSESGTTLTSGVDPDPLIAAAGDAVAKFRAPTEKQPGVIAFHGSGADFDEFKLEKIGTGEGAQAYGYGLYFAEKEDIAKFYKDTVSEQARKLSYDGKEDAAKAVQTNVPFTVEDDYRYYVFGDAEEVIDNALAVQRGEAPSESYVNNQLMAFDRDGALLIEMPDGTSLSLLKSLSGDTFTATPVASSQEGKMYKVGLEPKPEDMMDYQVPIADQDQKFLKAFKEIYHDRIKSDPQLSDLYPTPDSLTMKDIGLFDKSIVGQAYNTFAKELFNGDEAALTQALLEKGVSGIKYRDAGSRGGAKSLKDASFNYVIFDDKMIKILEKYGIVGPVAITGVAASQQEGESANVDT